MFIKSAVIRMTIEISKTQKKYGKGRLWYNLNSPAGNVYGVSSQFSTNLKQLVEHGVMTKEQKKAAEDDLLSGDYEHALQTFAKHLGNIWTLFYSEEYDFGTHLWVKRSDGSLSEMEDFDVEEEDDPKVSLISPYDVKDDEDEDDESVESDYGETDDEEDEEESPNGKKLKFAHDDNDERCWEHPEEGWASEADRDVISEEFRTMIEAHPEFQGWEEKDDGFEDCECGYAHHYEDKCPKGEQTRHYEPVKT